VSWQTSADAQLWTTVDTMAYDPDTVGPLRLNTGGGSSGGPADATDVMAYDDAYLCIP
jgi:hypothetical protein